MLAKYNFGAVMLLLCCCPAFVFAQADPNNWQKLNLSSTTIAGATVYYEKSFEPNLPFFEKKYKEFLSQRKQNDVFDAKKDQILADINTILGVTAEPNIALQEQALNFFNKGFSNLGITTFYLVKQSTTKDFLRKGGTLPNFTYDKAKDEVSFNPQFTGSSKDANIKNELAIPIASSESFDNSVATILQILQYAIEQNIGVGIAIHEITEMTMMMRVKPDGPYWRWFSDGFANAITDELLKKHFGKQFADNFVKTHDVNDYRELQKELNLRYWMSGQYCILPEDMPTERGKSFSTARYAYATFEAHKLIDKYGIDCVRKILDEIAAKESRTGSELIATIKNVTGEDMDARLNEYQTFEKWQDGNNKYVAAFNKISDTKDYEQMLFNLLRGNELFFVSEQKMQIMVDEHTNAAANLFKMGFQKQADTIMTNLIDSLSKSALPNGRESGLQAYIIYTFDCNQPTKARQFAEELLKTVPDNPYALTVKMLAFLDDKKLDQAKELANKVINQQKNKNSSDYQIATQILAIDPNKLNVGK
jgi:hypothetical protein